jgi:hypothetical protein
VAVGRHARPCARRTGAHGRRLEGERRWRRSGSGCTCSTGRRRSPSGPGRP